MRHTRHFFASQPLRPLIGVVLLLLLIPVTVTVLQVQQRLAQHAATNSLIKNVFVIVMENENWSNFKGSSSAPYINNTLLPMGAHAEQYYNPPGMHPSEPNYLWLEAGTNFGILNDNSVSSNHQSTTNHLVTQLNNAGLSWKAYEENISGTSCPTTDSGEYAARHDPFVFFDDVTSNSSYCTSHIRPYTELATDLTNNTVAQYNFITPNLCDDGHDSCSPLNNQVAQIDTWLKNEVPKILNSQAYKNGGAIMITWDEGGGGSDGPIGMIVLSPYAKTNYSNTIHYTHSSTLRTLQELFGVTPFLGDAANATDLRDLFQSAVFTAPSTTTNPTPSSQPGTGTSYYIDCNGNDANSGTATTSAWQSLTKASSVALSPGDSLLFKRGCVWNGTLKLSSSGTATNHITIGAYGTGSLPEIQYGVTGNVIVQIYGSYMTIDSLYADALPPTTDPNCQNNPVGWLEGFGFESGSHDDTVQNSQATGGWAGADVQSGASNEHILHNQFTNNIMMSPLTSGGNDDAGAFAVTLHGDNSEVAYNTLNGSDACSYDYGRDGSAVEVYGGQNNNIHHNTALNDDAFTELGNSRSANNTYAYNLFVSSGVKSIFINTRGASSSLGPVNGTVGYNNTAYLTGSSSQAIVCGSGCTGAILKLRNNIFQAVQHAAVSDTQFDEDYDIFTGGSVSGFTIGSHSKITNPLFVSPGSDFHLQSGSPAIDAGTNVGYTADLDNHIVPVGPAPDMGAYEYASTITVSPTPTTTTPPSPTPLPGSDLIQNSSFETTGTSWLSPWIFVTNSGATGTIKQDTTTAADGNASARVDISVANATSPWFLQLQHPNLSLQAGQTYTVSYSLKASSSRSITVNVQDSSTNAWIAGGTPSLATAWQNYSFPFTASTTQTAYLAFNVAGATGTVWIDNVHITTGSVTPTLQPTNTPTPKPTNTPTPVPPTATPTPRPTNTPIPTNTPVPNSTLLSLPSVLLHGLGTAGDSVNPGSNGNLSPLHPSRTVSASFYNSSGQLVTTQTGTITYQSATGDFKGSVDLGSTFASGTYTVKVSVPQFLVTQVVGFYTISQGQTVNLPQFSMIAGDANGDNRLDILDYNELLGCYSDLAPATNCPGNNKQATDFSDDGNVNQTDYNLFLRELSVRTGQ